MSTPLTFFYVIDDCSIYKYICVIYLCSFGFRAAMRIWTLRGDGGGVFSIQGWVCSYSVLLLLFLKAFATIESLQTSVQVYK